MLLGNKLNLKTKDIQSDSNPAEVAAGRAEFYFDQGYNCAQAVFMAASDVIDGNAPSELICALSAFTGGIGHSGCTCGALVGATMFIGTYTMNHDKPTKSKATLKQSGSFHDIFKNEFGKTCCRALRKDRSFKDKQANRDCKNITVRTAELVVTMLIETM